MMSHPSPLLLAASASKLPASQTRGGPGATDRASGWTRNTSSRDLSKVMLVRDGSAPVSDSLVQFLRRGSFTVKVCGAADAPALLNDGPWDVLVIDAEAAADTAVALTRLVRQSFSATELPILFVGTQATLDTRNEALAAGANDWTAHPLDPAEMTRRAANLAALSRLRRAHRTVESEFEREIAGRTARLDALIESGLMMSMERDSPTFLVPRPRRPMRRRGCRGTAAVSGC